MKKTGISAEVQIYIICNIHDIFISLYWPIEYRPGKYCEYEGPRTRDLLIALGHR